MKLFKKKRTVNVPLACLYHREFNPAWLTDENLDRIPTCTDCNLHLIPETLKEVLISGVAPKDLQLTPAEALTAACTAVTILWSHLNSSGTPLTISVVAEGDVWAPEAHLEWPAMSQESFLDAVGDGLALGSPELGSLTDHLPYLASVASNLLWRLDGLPSEVTVNLWPKDALAVLSSSNYQAFVEYMKCAEAALPGQKVWVLLDRLNALLSKRQPDFSSNKLIGLELSVQTMTNPYVFEDWAPSDEELASNRKPLNTQAGSAIDPYGPDSPKRLYMKFEPNLEILGPFEQSVRIVDAIFDDVELKLVHEYRFKVLISAETPDVAIKQLRTRFFQKFGFTIMQRPELNWRMGDRDGVDWNQFDSITESWLFSKVVEVKPLNRSGWEGTVWQSRCS